MLLNKEEQMSESYLVGILLAVVGGYLDAYTYVCRGQVFANAQTGNMVLLGIQLAQGNFFKALHYFVPIITFFAGIFFVELIKSRFKRNYTVHWRQIAIAIEFVALMVVAFLPGGRYDALAIILVSFVCSLQAQSFRKFNGNAYASTMCTGNLRSASEHFFRYCSSNKTEELKVGVKYLIIILFFISGAIIGCYLTKLYEIKSVLFSCMGLAMVFLLMIKKPQN
ncbi:YoaK family protein [Aminipila terrae]|uniref:YoaK family protein n=1 Tax=Aminipila terrae TaxID=2697030 RepID=UPI001FADF881|nr:YoaK family protein [Aminipila terrae]